MTKGISPKAVAAFFYPFIATCGTVGIKWLSDGTFDKTTLIVGVSGLITSGLALLGAYIHEAGNTAPNVGVPSDALLSSEQRSHAALGIPPQEETVSPPTAATQTVPTQ